MQGTPFGAGDCHLLSDCTDESCTGVAEFPNQVSKGLFMLILVGTVAVIQRKRFFHADRGIKGKRGQATLGNKKIAGL